MRRKILLCIAGLLILAVLGIGLTVLFDKASAARSLALLKKEFAAAQSMESKEARFQRSDAGFSRWVRLIDQAKTETRWERLRHRGQRFVVATTTQPGVFELVHSDGHRTKIKVDTCYSYAGTETRTPITVDLPSGKFSFYVPCASFH